MNATQLPLFAFTMVCYRCQIEKPLSDFYKAKAAEDGTITYKVTCKVCMRSPVHPPSSKVCSKCGIEKLVVEFEKHRRQCRQCIKDIRQARVQPVTIGTKFCRGCQTEKSIDNFPVANGEKDGHKSRCRECVNKRERKQRYIWRRVQANKARMKYQKDHEHCKEHRNSYSREWYKKHPEFIRVRTAKRRTRQYKVKYENVNYDRVIEQSGDSCYICGSPILPNQKTHFDHVIPLARGGSHTTENLRVTHAICNLRKHDFLLKEMTDFQRRGL